MKDLESGLKLFNKNIIDQIFIETDKYLTQKTDLVLIGGTALVVKYLSPRATLDVDSYSAISKELKEAWKKAEKKIGVTIPLSKSPISEGPYNMEDRFTSYDDLKLKFLSIYVPDPVDILLMKVTRLFGKDRDDIKHLIKHSKIKESILLKRYFEEMDYVVGNTETILSHYLIAIEDNFGKKIADKHEKKLKS